MSISHVDLIRDSLGLLGVLRETQAPTAEQGEHGLRVLNEMMADWEVDGVDLGFVPSTSLADALSVDDGDIAPVKYNLAHALAPYYGRQTPPVVLERAISYYNRLLRQSMVDELEPVSLEHIPLGRRGYKDDFDNGY